MTEKYKKIFGRIILGTALFWLLAFLADILVPWLLDVFRDTGNLTSFGDYGSIVSTIAAIVCFLVIVIALIVCLVKSRNEKKN